MVMGRSDGRFTKVHLSNTLPKILWKDQRRETNEQQD